MRNPKIYLSVQHNEMGMHHGQYTVVRSEHWSTFDPTIEFFTFLNEARLNYGTSSDIQERALVTATIIAVSTVVGSFVIYAVSTNIKLIAAAEANHISEIDQNAREAELEHSIKNLIMVNNASIEVTKDLEKHEFLITISAQPNNFYCSANNLVTKLAHLLKLKNSWGFEDPFTELYQSSIWEFLTKGIRGLTKAKYGELQRIMTGMTTIQTSIFSTLAKAKEYKASILTKMMIIPEIDSLSITEYESKDSKLTKKHCKHSKPGLSNISPTRVF